MVSEPTKTLISLSLSHLPSPWSRITFCLSLSSFLQVTDVVNLISPSCFGILSSSVEPTTPSPSHIHGTDSLHEYLPRPTQLSDPLPQPTANLPLPYSVNPQPYYPFYSNTFPATHNAHPSLPLNEYETLVTTLTHVPMDLTFDDLCLRLPLQECFCLPDANDSGILTSCPHYLATFLFEFRFSLPQ
ncbi:hypothetical protein Cgig2_033899 [Carnegiea gigantea]|uniref:Uncharacterized protein n=1 Tax=Carnegiea gigantea TaxID=171969 RepID=A0A9Q1GJ46_9CARY|nr:hypothetical protein Cgig2_033899 [Carnegiea gigantea]